MGEFPRKNTLFANYLNKNFEKMIKPLNFTMSLLMCPHYEINGGFVTPISCLRKVKFFLMTIAFLIIVYYRLKSATVFAEMNSENFESKPFVVSSVYIDNLYYSCVYIAIFLANVRNTTENTALIINLQKAIRNLRYVNIHLKKLTIWNIVSMLIIVLYFFMNYFVTYDTYTMASILNLFPLMYFDIHLMYMYRVMWIIKQELKMWINEMQQYRETFLKSVEYKNMPCGNKKFQTYQFIFNAFDIYKKVCKVPISSQVLSLVIHSLLYVQVNIDIKKQYPEQSVSSFLLQKSKFSILIWLLKNVLLLSFVCYACERFYILMQKADEICNNFLNLEIPDDFRRLCKNVPRLKRARFDCVRVCGIPLQFRLVLQTIGVITGYIAVILQFNFK